MLSMVVSSSLRALLSQHFKISFYMCCILLIKINQGQHFIAGHTFQAIISLIPSPREQRLASPRYPVAATWLHPDSLDSGLDLHQIIVLY